MAAVAGKEVRIYTGNGHDWTEQFGYLAPALSELTKRGALIDGKICAVDEHGRSNFSKLKTSMANRPSCSSPSTCSSKTARTSQHFLSSSAKCGCNSCSRDNQKARLSSTANMRLGHRREVFKTMCKGHFEGVIAKSPAARYYGDRSEFWLTVKCVQRQEFVIVGWRRPDYGDADIRGFFLGTFENGKLVYRGGVGTGLTDRQRRDFRQLLGTIENQTATTDNWDAEAGDARSPLGATATAS